jgi:hypothetical protein
LAELVGTKLHVWWLKNNFVESKSLGPKLLLLLTLHVRLVGWPGAEKNLALQNALLNESRVFNSKCPKHFAGVGGQKTKE